ncbi:MAG: sulfur transferase domain-containing protein [Pseudomonadota bacterium]
MAIDPPPPRVVEISAGTGLETGAERTISKSLSTWRGRLWAWFDMLVIDHGLVRMVFFNRGRVGDGVWRAAQPAPHQLRAEARKGVRTILNLRAERDCGAFLLEEETCAELGLTLVNLQVRSRDVPSKEMIWALDRLFQESDRAILMHCKSGSDRTGIVGTLYQVLQDDVPVADAVRSQLHWRWGHVRQHKTGMLDFFFESYLVDTRERPMSFRQWVDEVYDPETVKARFMERFNPILGFDLMFWRE